MKKVLVLAALAALVSTSAFATVVGTKHDLSASGPSTVTDATEVCVFCHTPHGAVTSTKYTPLWNRTAAIDPTGFYTSTSMNHTTSLANTIATDAYLCLSCHDGAQALEALGNPPNTGLTDANTVIAGTAALDLDLSNDHPIGFIYGGAAVDGRRAAGAEVGGRHDQRLLADRSHHAGGP
ncbi:MAG: hypothetical protein U1D97_12185, partial [Desulfuromonadales bacterium]|nr:hypothetical protein [Desulfuromonadales bacterium]